MHHRLRMNLAPHAEIPRSRPPRPVEQLKQALEDAVATLDRLARVIEEKRPPG